MANNFFKQKKKNKYFAIKTEVDGIIFDSKKEAARYSQLKLLQGAREIGPITCHPEFPIIINGVKVCIVKLDFQYTDWTGKTFYEDVKSIATMTSLSRLKHKLVKACYGIEILIT